MRGSGSVSSTWPGCLWRRPRLRCATGSGRFLLRSCHVLLFQWSSSSGGAVRLRLPGEAATPPPLRAAELHRCGTPGPFEARALLALADPVADSGAVFLVGMNLALLRTGHGDQAGGFI